MELLVPSSAGAAPSRSTMAHGGRAMRTIGRATTEREHNGVALMALPPGSSPGICHQESHPRNWHTHSRDENENGHEKPVRCAWSSACVVVDTVGGMNCR